MTAEQVNIPTGGISPYIVLAWFVSLKPLSEAEGRAIWAELDCEGRSMKRINPKKVGAVVGGLMLRLFRRFAKELSNLYSSHAAMKKSTPTKLIKCGIHWQTVARLVKLGMCESH
jgi:hypothetical protein